MMATATQGLDEVFLGRQPIIDAEHRTFGYDFFSPPSPAAVGVSPASTTADVVCKMFAELGLASALGPQRAFIPVDEEFLANDTIELIKERNVILAFAAATAVSDAMFGRLHDLRNSGYELCASGVTGLDPAIGRVVALARYIKVDAAALTAEELRQLALQLKSQPGELLATGVDSDAVFRACRDAGFRLFQGYFFAKPVIVEGRKLDPSTQTIFRIINLLREDADTHVIEDAFKGDPALSVNLLRLTNSVAGGLAVRIASIRQAVAILGRNQLQRWLQMLVFTSRRTGAGFARNPLMQLAALRARFMESLAERCFPGRHELRDAAFLTGLLSLMPAALGISILDILASITVAPEVRRALAKREGELGELLALTERYDDNDREATFQILCRLGGRMDFLGLGECLSEVIAWVQGLDTEVA